MGQTGFFQLRAEEMLLVPLKRCSRVLVAPARTGEFQALGSSASQVPCGAACWG